LYFFDEKLQFSCSLASIKDAQATGEAFSPKKRTSSTSKHKKSLLFKDFFLYLWVISALLDPDQDSATQNNADPCGSGSTTLHVYSWMRANRIHACPSSLIDFDEEAIPYTIRIHCISAYRLPVRQQDGPDRVCLVVSFSHASFR
jgi:hypothetical protein